MQKNTPLETMYMEYANTVKHFLISLCGNFDLAEDLTQETFYQAYKSAHRYNGNCKISVWLCQIAKHLYFAQKRKEKHSAIMTLDEVSDHLPDTTSQPLELRIADETDAMRILEYLHDIEEPYKEVFMLRVFGELSFKKISGIFGKTESWARVTYHRAKVKILNEMEGKQ